MVVGDHTVFLPGVPTSDRRSASNWYRRNRYADAHQNLKVDLNGNEIS
jgi:hypothetical protein